MIYLLSFEFTTYSRKLEMKIFWTLILLLPTLSGCSNPVRPESLRYYSLSEADYFTEAHQNALFKEERHDRKTPIIGLALAGGGTKAADFGLGVIQGLNEIGLLKNVDIISSVSGGGYSALWYYSRLINEKDTTIETSDEETTKRSFEAIIKKSFNDCLPKRYEIDGSKEQPCTFFNTNTEGKNVSSDLFKDQNYLRGYQDILSSGKTAFDYNPTTEKNQLTKDIASLSAKTIGAIILNIFPNIFFDWQIQVSPSRQAYAKGISRTFGAIAPSCSNKGGCDQLVNSSSKTCINNSDKKCIGYNRRLEGEINWVENLTFENLKNPNLPMWIINTTAGEDRSPWDLKKALPPELTVFEFTPYNSGSGQYGYQKKLLHTKLSPIEAVLASASFFDSQQKNTFVVPVRNFVALGMEATTLNWGVSYINPNANKGSVFFHHLLPWPLYYFHKFNAGYDSAYIHLSDGGHSENLGVYSLIRRNVPNIIISDHAADRSGTMSDICLLKNNLKSQNLFINFPGLEDIESVCSPKSVTKKTQKMGYDIFNWTYPVLLGCITKGSASKDCLQQSGGSDYFARIFLIKPSISGQNFDINFKNAVSECKINGIKEEVANESCLRKIENICKNHTYAAVKMRFKFLEDNELKFWNSANPPSCELLMFLMKNSFEKIGINKTDGCPHFPQYSTSAITVNSSPWLYGALKELGRYYAGSLSYFYDSSTNTFDKGRFESILLQQSNTKIIPITVGTSLFSSIKSGSTHDCAGLGISKAELE